MFKQLLLIFISVTLGLSSFAQDLSDRLLFSARLAGSNNTTVVDADAVGLATFYLNSARDTLYVNAAVGNFDNAFSGLKIQSGEASIDGPIIASFDTSIVENKVNSFITDSMLIDLLPGFIAGDFYLNAYDENNPQFGTARGQIKLEREFSFYANLDTAQTVPGSLDSRAFASANFRLDQNGDSLEVKLVTVGLEEEISAIHLHQGVTGEAGPVLLNLSALVVSGTRIDSVMALPDSVKSTLETLIRNGEVYVNVHTESNPAGEIRGQALFSDDLYFDVFADNSEATQIPLFAADAASAGHAYLSKELDSIRYFIVYELDSLSSDPLITSFTNNGVPAKTLTPDSGRIVGSWASDDATQPLNAAAITGFFSNTIGFQMTTNNNPVSEFIGNVGRSFRDGYVFNLDTNQLVEDVTVSDRPLGAGMLSINTRGTNVHYMMAYDGLSSDVSAVSINSGLSTETGPVLFNLNASEGGAFGYIRTTDGFDADAIRIFQGDSAYIRVATSINSSIEIRGNLNRTFAETATSIIKAGENFSALTAYPNPTEKVLNIALNSTVSIDDAEVAVIDLVGNEVFVKTQNISKGNNQFQLNVGSLKTGVYMIQLKSDQNAAVLRFIKN